jgi:hypothetical protein
MSNPLLVDAARQVQYNIMKEVIETDTKTPAANQDLYRLKVNGKTILETHKFCDCLDQAWMLIRGYGMPESAIDILRLDKDLEMWLSIRDEEAINEKLS